MTTVQSEHIIRELFGNEVIGRSSNRPGWGIRKGYHFSYVADMWSVKMSDVYNNLKHIFKSTRIKNIKFKDFVFEITLDDKLLVLKIIYAGSLYKIKMKISKSPNFESNLNNKIVEVFHHISNEKREHNNEKI